MTRQSLSQADAARVVALFDHDLAEAPLEKPHVGESEPSYTARALIPLVTAVHRRLSIEGMTIAGDGTTRPVPTYLLGHRFYPDIAISHFGQRLAAYEVKFLRSRSRSNTIATAFGQSALYHLDRYPHVRAVLLDRLRVGRDDLEHARKLTTDGQGSMALIYRSF